MHLFQIGARRSLYKKELAQHFHVTERSIQRDLGALRCFLAEQDIDQEIVYDKVSCRYYIQDAALSRCVPEQNKKAVQELISNEKYHYIEPYHNKQILSGLWEIGQAVQKHQVLEIQYERMKDPKFVTRRVQPVGIMFSEYYFYLTAFLEDKTTFDNPNDLFPTIYRTDRIRSFKVLDDHFRVPYKERFEEGEFRKRVQFMYGGKLEHIKFRYIGPSLEAVLDRLPTAVATKADGEGWIVEAEVFGKGIEMWLRSQGNYIEKID